MYNLTTAGNVTNVLQFTQNVNTYLMDGWFGVMILGVLYVIMFMAFLANTRQPVRSFTGASFIGMGLSFLMFIMGLVPVIAVYVMVISLAAGIAFWNLD